MGVNGVTGTNSTADLYGTYNTTSAKAAEKTETTNTDDKKSTSTGVVYEPSKDAASATADTANTKKTYKQNTALVEKMKADAEQRTSQLKSLVEQMISKQGKTLGQADSIWSFLAGGDFTVDPATKAQAQKDIAEDGYWGVEQTSSRIIDFATALTGGDPDQLKKCAMLLRRASNRLPAHGAANCRISASRLMMLLWRNLTNWQSRQIKLLKQISSNGRRHSCV